MMMMMRPASPSLGLAVFTLLLFIQAPFAFCRVSTGGEYSGNAAESDELWSTTFPDLDSVARIEIADALMMIFGDGFFSSPSPPSLPTTFSGTKTLQNISYKGTHYARMISYSENGELGRRATKEGSILPFAPKAYIATPYEWLNTTTMENDTFSGVVLNGQPLLVASPNPRPFHSLFEWVKGASYGGGNRTVLNQSCDLWSFKTSAGMVLEVYVNEKTGNPVYFYELVPGVIEQSFLFYDYNANEELPGTWETHSLNDFLHPALCPKAGFTIETTTFYIFHPAHQFNLSSQDWGDSVGDTFFTCADLISNRPSVTDHNYSWISSYEVEFLAQYGQYQNCNNYPPTCIGANDFFVGHEAAYGLALPPLSGLPATGQCEKNNLVGEWYSLPERGECNATSQPGDGSCTWRATRKKTIDSKCLFQEQHFEELCRKDERAPFPSAVAAFENAFASEDASKGGCPHLNVNNGEVGENEKSIVVETTLGAVKGRLASDSTATFFGIPYAKPPVGNLRWQPPEPAEKWSGVRSATDPGPACLQTATFASLNQSEDCLRLHVWTKNLGSDSGRLRPVMVWLHGGGLVEGSSFSIQSGMGSVANVTGENDAVVIGIEYRLGVAGFLALDALAGRDNRGKGCAGNYGLLDAIEALRWVKKNAKAFGGDPDRITVFGQSSGGSLVFALLASPLVAREELLHGGISLSGSPLLNATTRDAFDVHKKVVAKTRCASLVGNASTLAKCLLSLSAKEIVEATPDTWHTDGFGFSVFQKNYTYDPILLIDDCTIPKSYYDTLPRQNLIIGATAQESDFSPQDDVRDFLPDQFAAFVREHLAGSYGDSFVNELLDLYVGRAAVFEPQRIYSDIVTDATILCPNAYLASRWSHSHDGVYAYFSRQRLQNPFCVLEPFNTFKPPYCPLYSFHASDMFMWFGPRYDAATFDYRMTPQDLAFGSLMQKRFAEFAALGKISAWKPFAAQGSFLKDRLPERYFATDFALPDAAPVPLLRQEYCNFWLKHGFYENHGLIN